MHHFSWRVGFTFAPFLICPQPINLQCLSTLRLSAIFSPTSVQTGVVSPIFAKSAFTAITRPPTIFQKYSMTNMHNLWLYQLADSTNSGEPVFLAKNWKLNVTCRKRTNVHHQHFTLAEFCYFCSFLVSFCTNSQKTPQKIIWHLELSEYFR